MKRLLSYVNIRDLVTSITASIIVLGMLACGGAANMLPPIVRNASGFMAHLVSLPGSNSTVQPGTTAIKLATAFDAATPAPSQLSQAFAVKCLVPPLVAGEFPSPGQLLVIPGFQELSTPGNICDQVIDPPQPQLDSDDGETFFSGNLTAFIVTGVTKSRKHFECRDNTTLFSVDDNSFTAAYLDPFGHTVKLFNQTQDGTVKPVPFVCSGVGSDSDPVVRLSVKWAKI